LHAKTLDHTQRHGPQPSTLARTACLLTDKTVATIPARSAHLKTVTFSLRRLQ